MPFKLPFGSRGRELPKDLWTKCPGCEELLYNKRLAGDLWVCSKCGHHFRIRAETRLALLVDGESFRERDAGLESVDPLGHAFAVKIDLPAMSGLRSGLFGHARFQAAQRRGIAIPSSAVLRRGQLTLVFTEEGGLARMRIVQVADEAGGLTRVTAGLADGDRVVVNPPAELADGRPVSASGRAR